MLIGAATVLVVIVALFLSYNANAGLPFVPTYQLKVEAPSAAALVKGNEVRIGGTRVGAVDTITTRRRDDGTSVAVIGMKLERAVDPLPKDSTIIIRPKSALGLKYVQITRGTSEDGYQDGDTIPVSASKPTEVEFDEFVNMFDDDTRAASQENLRGFGDALAGRGASLNVALGVLPALLRDIQPVARNLSNPETGLKTFFNELGDAARIVAPAAETQADLFVNLDTTFTALNGVARPYIQDSITEGVPALDAAIESFPIQRPFLRNTEGLFHELRPGVKALSTAAPDLADALEIGTPTLLRTPPFNRRLASLLTELQTFANDPVAPRGVKRLAETLEDAEAAARLPRARPAHLQLPDAVVPQRLLAAVGGRRPRHLAAVHHHRHAAGPQQRGRPLQRPRQRADVGQLPALEPVPEHGVAGPAQGVRVRQRAVPGRPQGDRQPARQAARRHGGHQVMAASRQRRRRNRSPLTVGVIALAIILVGVWLGFTKDIPFTHGFRVKATFASANSLRLNSPVRIAGVAVGKVKKVEAKEGTDEAVVTLELKKSALPIHEDATAKIRPRIFLEGNFFVDLQPGTPSSPKLADGDVIKVTRTATPVQLDQVLTSLQSDTRQDLRDLLDGLAVGLNSKPSAADDKNADKSARGQTAAESFNDAYRDSPGALKGTAQVNEALLGTEPDRDVARLLDGRGEDDRRADPQRGPAQGPDHELQHDDGGVRERGRPTSPPRSACSRRRS